jgi:hypothetical protein
MKLLMEKLPLTILARALNALLVMVFVRTTQFWITALGKEILTSF